MNKEACRDCGTTEEVANGLCYTCEVENHVYCNVCEKFIIIDEARYRHRHVFTSEHDEWIGSGGVDMNERYEQEIKEALFFVLDNIPAMTVPLAHSIQQGKMDFDAIHLYGPAIFGPVMVWCSLTDGNGHLCFFTDDFNAITHEVVSNDDEEHQKALEYCVRWLISLDNETKDANEMTLHWIEEWQQLQGCVS